MSESHEQRPTFLHWLVVNVLPPLFIGVIGIVGILGLAIKFRPKPEAAKPIRVVPAVEVAIAAPKPIEVIVESQGTVQARTQSTLLAEVSGRVESVSPALYAGGFFEKGEALARIDDTEYKANLANARSKLAEAQLALDQEKATSAQALEDWQAMGNESKPTELVLRKPQLARAEANAQAAAAAVEIAERDLRRTEVRAPYDGRVREKFIDVGQMVNARSSQIASIYSVDVAEIRLPLSLDDLRYIQLPESFRDSESEGPKPSVSLMAEYGGQTYVWEGVIDRSEGAVDPQSRLINVVAQVKDPYGKGDQPDRPPLKVGTFVTARIHGQTLANAFKLPRRALRRNDTLYLIDQQNHLQIRPVTVYKKNPESIIVEGQLSEGDRVCLTPLQYAVDGMDVTIDTQSDETKAVADNGSESPDA